MHVTVLTLLQRRRKNPLRDATLKGGAGGPFSAHVKLIRLQSGPLACVYQDEDVEPAAEREDSGVYRAFSGSVEAKGASESEALDSLDRTLLRLSSPPADLGSEGAEADPAQGSPNDTDLCPPRFQSMLPPSSSLAPDTVRAPRPSSLPALAFARAR